MSDLLAAGTAISHYRVLSLIGIGGMGEVYLAEDTTLGRRVALKLLPTRFVEDEDRLRRFEQEARAASALNHPNIITIHEVGSDRDTRFIAMEFIEGENLRHRLKRGKLSPREAIDVAIQVGNALASAHNAGIVHRDIKPENVMLRPDGYVKVLDFGVVKLTEKFVEQRTAEHHGELKTVTLVSTEANIVMGSPNYMSPEQARGLPVDARTDIFSLGAVLYEMITGKLPFDGATVSDIVVSLLERDPPSIESITPGINERLEQVVYKALSKERDGRYQTAQEFVHRLKRVKRRIDFEAGLEDSFQDELGDTTDSMRVDQDSRITVKAIAGAGGTRPPGVWSASHLFKEIKDHRRGSLLIAIGAVAIIGLLIFLLRSPAGPQSIESIAVLPFVNESGDQNTEYLSDGITESLINNLSQSPRLKVTSRNSSFRLKGRDLTAKAVAKELGVEAVLSGRISQRGDSLQINVALVDAREDIQLWGQQFNRPMSDLLAAQEEIARHVVEKLELRLSGADQSRVSKQGTDNPEAYQLYLRGRYHWNKRTEEGMRKGIEYFNEAIVLDPLYARSYTGLADCYAMLTEYSAQPPTELFPKAKAAAERALAIDDTLAEAHTSLAAAYEYEWDWRNAESEYRRAIELNANYATAQQWYGVFLSSHQRNDEAISRLKQALDLDPLSLIINTSVGRAYFAARQYDRAIEQLRKTLEIDPNFAEARFQLAMVYEQKKLYREAEAEFARCVELFSDPAMRAWLGRVYALEGRRQDAERILSEMNQVAQQKYVSPYPLATVYAALGDKDHAMQLLEKVFDERSYYVVWLNVDPIWDGMRGDRRFGDLLARIGFEKQ